MLVPPDASGTAGITYQRYKPYGQQRGGDTITTTDHGYLGQIEDPTGLTYLNNRYLDPTTARFASVDPLVNITRDAYGYARNNPIAYSDPSGLDIDQQGTGTNSMGCNKCSQDPVKRPRGENVSGPTITTSGGIVSNDGVSVPTSTVDQAGKTLLGDNTGAGAIGACGDFSFGVAGGVDVQSCVIATGNDWGLVGSVGGGVQTNMSLTGGLIFSNAKQLSDLNGPGVCAGVSFGSGATGGVTVCGGLTPDAKFSGVVTVFPNFGIGLSEGGGVVGAELLMTWTSTGSFGATPGWVRWILPRFGPGPQSSGPPEGGTIRNSGGDYTGRWDGGSPGGFANAGTPT